MVQPGRPALDKLERGLRQILRIRRGADLIVDDLYGSFGLGPPQEALQEAVPIRAEQPARTDDADVVGVELKQGLLTGKVTMDTTYPEGSTRNSNPSFQPARRAQAIAVLNDCPTSPLKMRIVADTIRGVEINRALGMLRFSKKAASIKLEKLLRSAIANWEQKNEGQRLEDNKLCVSEIYVNSGTMLKRIQAAPQGRAHRIRKRSNSVTIVVDKMEVKEEKNIKADGTES